jgi:hypothetical protein
MGIRTRSVSLFLAGALCSIALPAMAAKNTKTIQSLQPILSVFMTREDVAAMISDYDAQMVAGLRSDVSQSKIDQQDMQEQMNALLKRVEDLEALLQDEEEESFGWMIGEDPPPTCSADQDCPQGYVCEVPAPSCGPSNSMCAEGSESCFDVICVSAPPHCVPGS